MKLTEPQRRALRAVAAYGEAHYSHETTVGPDARVYWQSADALERLGLVEVDRGRRGIVTITDAGRTEARGHR